MPTISYLLLLDSVIFRSFSWTKQKQHSSILSNFYTMKQLHLKRLTVSEH